MDYLSVIGIVIVTAILTSVILVPFFKKSHFNSINSELALMIEKHELQLFLIEYSFLVNVFSIYTGTCYQDKEQLISMLTTHSGNHEIGCKDKDGNTEYSVVFKNDLYFLGTMPIKKGINKCTMN